MTRLNNQETSGLSLLVIAHVPKNLAVILKRDYGFRCIWMVYHVLNIQIKLFTYWLKAWTSNQLSCYLIKQYKVNLALISCRFSEFIIKNPMVKYNLSGTIQNFFSWINYFACRSNRVVFLACAKVYKGKCPKRNKSSTFQLSLSVKVI